MKMKTPMAHLCQCNKCDLILIDQNPQVGAIEYELQGDEVEMQYKDDGSGGYWVCPVCDTDGNLQDEITIRTYPPPQFDE